MINQKLENRKVSDGKGIGYSDIACWAYHLCKLAGDPVPDNWREWLATWEQRYGPTIAVPRFTISEHERIDPLSEAAEIFPPGRIVVITPPAGS